jgi:phosphatidylglycerol:prolipoprotein diacylglycerol transferase
LRPLIPWFQQPEIDIPVPKGLPFDHIPIHGFGVLVALGFLLGGRVAMQRARRLGLDPEQINRLIGWLVIGTFVGGHVGNGLMYEPEKYLADPIQFLRVWDGLSSFGGFIVCVPLCWYFFWHQKLPVWPYLDCIAYGLTIGWFLGRMGCFVAHDHPGYETQFFLGVYGICWPGNNAMPEVACHDTGLYEALWSLATFGSFYWLDQKPRVPGFYPLALGISYAPARILLDGMRPEDSDLRYFGYTPAQYCSAVFFVVCAVWLYQRMRSGDAPVWAPPGTEPAATAPQAPPKT